MIQFRKHIIIALLLLFCSTAFAQTDSATYDNNGNLHKLLKWQNNLTEKILRNENSFSDRKVKFMFMPGLGRTPDYGFALGAGMGMSFYTSNSDSLLSRSIIPLSFTCTVSSPFSYKIHTAPQFYFKQNRLKLSVETQYHKWVEYYFGVGYSVNHSTPRETGINSYTSQLFSINPNFQVKIGDLPLYGGIEAMVWHENVKRPGNFVVNDPHYIASGGTAEGLTSTGTGVGPALSMDTRDNNYDSTRGIYFHLRSLFYSSLLGGDAKYSTLTLDYRQYHKFSERGGVLAWNVTSNNAFGSKIPFMRYATIGGIMPFRGYYGYQYRNRSVLTAQAEYRYMFSISGPLSILVNRFGFSVWGGFGATGDNPVKYEALLPEIGAGLKMRLTRYAVFRCDCGYGTADNRFLWYIGMSQSF